MLSPLAHQLSEKNMVKSRKNQFPQKLGSRGYARKVPKWEWRAHELDERGVQVQTVAWDL